MAISQQGFGWHPSLPDFRDLQLAAAVPLPAAPPPRIDLTNLLPAVRDQGPIGSCTGFGGTAAYYATSKANGRYPVNMSPLFAYYNARRLEGTTRYDSGATIRDVVKGMAKYGVAQETDWPYGRSPADTMRLFDDVPPQRVYTRAEHHQVLRYYAVGQSSLALRTALATGYPVIIGFSVYESFMSDEVERTGTVPMPEPGEAMVGGHCVILCGYDMDIDHPFRCQNSWSTGWGDDGYFRFPEAYLTNPRLAGDYWTLRLTEG